MAARGWPETCCRCMTPSSVRCGPSKSESGETKGAVIEGVELTMRELLNVFRKHGIEVISPEKGERFDPQRHQAMFEAPVPETRAGDIIEVMSDGFLLHDRLLRPAQVGVSSTPAPSK